LAISKEMIAAEVNHLQLASFIHLEIISDLIPSRSRLMNCCNYT